MSRAKRTLTHDAAERSNALEHLIHAIKNDIVGELNDIKAQNDALHRGVTDQLALNTSQLNRVAATTSALEAGLAASRDEIGFARSDLAGRLDELAPSVRLGRLVDARLDDIDEPASAFLNYSRSHIGPLADAGLWLNDPVVLEWKKGSVSVGAVNERIIEQPFVFSALGDLDAGAKILDLGGGESTVAFSLASLGFDVTVIEPQGYPFRHPNLTVFERPYEEFDRSARFDAVVLLSAIEHFGIGWYPGNPDKAESADIDTVASLRELMNDDGLLVLTTPYGPAETTDLERIYDLERLQRLLEGWSIGTVAIGKRLDHQTWAIESDTLTPPAGKGRVVMLTARPTGA